MRFVCSRGVVQAVGLFAALGVASTARAQDVDLFSHETITAVADMRLTAANRERSWIDGAFGKSRFGGTGSDDFQVRPKAVEGTLAWQPRLGWALGATIVAVAQDGQQHAIDLSEAFVTLRTGATGGVRASGRIGLMWPAVSLEHSGPEWAVTETITPSAIGSWIGEEVKLAGAEGTVSAPVGGGRIALTGAAFALNDTAGTLLAYRGWALHDEKAVAWGKQPLPPLNAFLISRQSAYTRPVIRIDNRIGYYAKLVWSPPAPFRIEAFRYDNRAEPQALNRSLEWGWRTTFETLGGVWDTGPVVLRVQGLTGRTRMGFPSGGVIWIDTRFRSAFLLATAKAGAASVSGRIEAFGTRNRGSQLTRTDDEDGWAATIAARRPIGRHVSLLAELLHIDSRREARLRAGTTPRQRQTIAQLALRLRL